MIRNFWVHSVAIVLYALLLAWPVYVLGSYLYLEESIRAIVPLSLMILDFLLGVLLIYKLWKPVKPMKTVWFVVWNVLLIGSLSAFLISLAIVYAPVLWGAV